MKKEGSIKRRFFVFVLEGINLTIHAGGEKNENIEEIKDVSLRKEGLFSSGKRKGDQKSDRHRHTEK